MPNGKTILDGSSDNYAILWDVAIGARLRTFTNQSISHNRNYHVNSVAYAPDSKTVLTGSDDGIPGGMAIVWNISDLVGK